MKHLFFFFPLFSFSFHLKAQTEVEKKIKTKTIFLNTQLSYYDSLSKEGNILYFYSIFEGKVDSQNAYIFDSLGRERFSIGKILDYDIHISENEYINNQIYHYRYNIVFSSDAEKLLFNKIDKYENILNYSFVKETLNRKDRKLSWIKVLDENGRIQTEFNIYDSDTIEVSTFEYDDKGNKIYCHFQDLEDATIFTDKYFVFDSLNNLISTLVKESNIVTDVFKYKYDKKGKLIKEVHDKDGLFYGKRTFFYDRFGNKIKVFFSESKTGRPDRITRMKYHNKEIIYEKIIEHRASKKYRKKIYKYVYTYY